MAIRALFDAQTLTQSRGELVYVKDPIKKPVALIDPLTSSFATGDVVLIPTLPIQTPFSCLGFARVETGSRE